MSHAYESLQPAPVWKIFADIARIPRGSGNERAVMAMLEARAKAKGFATKRDGVGNMLVTVPASKGRAKSAPVVLQGHVDMVCEKNADSTHDFAKDPIVPRVKGDWVVANGTTLGSDNGIGVSMMLAAAEDAKLEHGPLEILLTVDEERGLTGAAAVEPGFFTGTRLINLDSEDDTTLTIGCAGMQESLMSIRGARSAIAHGWTTLEAFVTGLKGGHSGIDIQRNRGNAIRILVRALLAGLGDAPGTRGTGEIRIQRIEGGNKRNAIAREARAAFAIPEKQAKSFEKAAKAEVARIRQEELAGIDEGLELRLTPGYGTDAWSAADSRRSLDLVGAVPHGVVAMSQEVEGLVESSTNLAVLSSDRDIVRVCCTSRSSVNSALDQLGRQHLCLAALAGAKCEQKPPTPGWKADTKSALLRIVRDRYTESFGHPPEVRGVHAGLECGVLKKRVPGLDAISFGPDIVGAHSPDESVKIASVQRIWKLLRAVLEAL